MIQVNRVGQTAVIRIIIPIPDAPSQYMTKQELIVQQAITELNALWQGMHTQDADLDAELARVQADIAARRAAKVTIDLS